MNIAIDWKTALIILLTAVIVIAGVYYYRDYRMDQMALKIQNTQIILGQLSFPRGVGDPLRRIGWEITKAPKSVPAEVLAEEKNNE